MNDSRNGQAAGTKGPSTRFILAMMLSGLLFGGLLNAFSPRLVTEAIAAFLLEPVGEIFIRGVKMLVAPLVVFSLAHGAATIGDPCRLGRIGGKITAYYIGTTALAITMAIVVANAIGPGNGTKLELLDTPGSNLREISARLIENGASAEFTEELYRIRGLIENTTNRKLDAEMLKRHYETRVIPALGKAADDLADGKMFQSPTGETGKQTAQTMAKSTVPAVSVVKHLAASTSFAREILGVRRDVTALAAKLKPAPGIIEVLLDMIPSNPFNALAEGRMLQIIFFSILLGLSATMIPAGSSAKVTSFLESGSQLMLTMIDLVMIIAPYGVFALVAKVVALEGFSMIFKLGAYMLTLLLVFGIQLFGVYALAVRFLAGLDPWKFFDKFKGVMAVAFSTSSSNATLPVNLETCEERLGVSNRICSFTIPFGATVNMDGTAMMQGVAAIFVSQLYGIPLGLSAQIQVILTATLASIGTAGVPGVGLVMLTMVFQQVGLPLEAIGILWSVDRILDMCRTVINVTGDAVGTLWVARSEGELNEAVFSSAD